MTTVNGKLPPIFKGTLDDNLPDDPRLPMLLNWGMPRNGARVRYTVSGEDYGAASNDFTVEFYGVWEYQDEPLTGRQIAISTGRTHELMDVWLRRTRLKGAHACIEETYHPLHDWQIMIYGIHLDPESERAKIIRRLAGAIGLGARAQKRLRKTASIDKERQAQNEALITQTIEKMAQSQKDTKQAKAFSRRKFNKLWSEARKVFISTHSVYYHVPASRNDELNARYFDRCRELRGE